MGVVNNIVTNILFIPRNDRNRINRSTGQVKLVGQLLCGKVISESELSLLQELIQPQVDMQCNHIITSS